MFRDRRFMNDDDKGDNNNNNNNNNGDDVHVFRDPQAPIHVVNGVGGNDEGSDILLLEGGRNTAPNFKMPEWSAFRFVAPEAAVCRWWRWGIAVWNM